MKTVIADYTTQQSMALHTATIGPITLKVLDYSLSMTPYFVFRELANDHYKLNQRPMPEGSRILDIGANVGIVSIYMAKLFRGATIYAYEPLSLNYDNLCKNIEINDVTNVVPVNKAVTADGRDLIMRFNFDNMGGATALLGQPPYNEARAFSVTLPSIFETHKIDHCAFLKMDVEGAEHEILASCNGLLNRVDYLAMEAHFSNGLRAKGYNAQTLQRSLQPLIARKAVQVTAQEVTG